MLEDTQEFEGMLNIRIRTRGTYQNTPRGVLGMLKFTRRGYGRVVWDNTPGQGFPWPIDDLEREDGTPLVPVPEQVRVKGEK